jgi:hypothetical protein
LGAFSDLLPDCRADYVTRRAVLIASENAMPK